LNGTEKSGEGTPRGKETSEGMICEATRKKHDYILRTMRRMEKTGMVHLASNIAEACGMKPRVLVYYLEQMEAEGLVEVGKGGGKRFWRTPGGPEYPPGVYPGMVGERVNNPIRMGEIEESRDRTRIGDVIYIRVQDKSLEKEQLERTKVQRKTRYLCIMQNGRAFSWTDMAMFYRTPGQILTMEG
jgi:hypothetical protein